MFYPCYKLKKQPDVSIDGSKQENIIAVTTRDLCEFYRQKTGKSINSDILKKTYLNELVKNGIIEEEVSNINNKQYLYYPIIELESESESISFISKSGHFDEDLQHSRIILPENCKNIPEDWLVCEILGFLAYRNGNECNESNTRIQIEDIKLFDKDGNRDSIKEFCEKYEEDHYRFRVKI